MLSSRLSRVSTNNNRTNQLTFCLFLGRIHYQSTYACEKEALDLHCEENEVIHLVRANYGRFSISICNEGGRLDYATNCMSFRSFLIMQDK